MISRARAWLRERADDVPASLASRMDRAVEAVEAVSADTAARADSADELVTTLAMAARACLDDALADPDERAAALDLLAADALITYACEAAAAPDARGNAISDLADQWIA